MSDNAKVLQYQLGTPLVWLKNAEDEILKDIDDSPLSSHVTSFEYTYDEENDDEARITFKFSTSANCDNIIFNQDSIIKLQWGYVTVGGIIIKSPVRSVAVRDIDRNYREDVIEITLECTDLISYIKNIKINSVASQKTDYFVDWLKEISEGKFQATITTKGYKTIIDKQGTTKDFKFDEKSNTVIQKTVDNARFETHKRGLSFTRVIKGKSLALSNAIDDLIKDLPDGPYIQDSTDDKLEIKTRNFNQDIFKNYTYKGGTGELIEFKAKTETKKITEDKKFSAKVDPKKKSVEQEDVDTADTSISSYLKNRAGNLSKKPDQAEIDQWLEKIRSIYEYNIQNPTNQKEVPDFTYKRSVIISERYMGQLYPTEKAYTYTLPAKEILNSPDISEKLANNRMTNRSIIKLQKKHQATCEIIGDPSLIKGKIYYFANLAKNDIGKWYSVKVKHNIGNGLYMTSMEMVKKPVSIVVNSSKTNSSKKDNEEELEFDNEIENTDIDIYPPEEDDTKSETSDNVDSNPETERVSRASNFEQQKFIDGVNDRLKTLKAEDDIFENLGIETDGYKIETDNIPDVNTENFNFLNKINADKS